MTKKVNIVKFFSRVLVLGNSMCCPEHKYFWEDKTTIFEHLKIYSRVFIVQHTYVQSIAKISPRQASVNPQNESMTNRYKQDEETFRCITYF